MDRIAAPGLVFGIGVGGAFDGIVFHQLLQWHHMVMFGGPSTWMFADGLFHTLSVAFLCWARSCCGGSAGVGN